MKTKIIALVAFAGLCMACTETKQAPKLLPVTNFEKQVDGKPVSLYTLQNKNGIVTQITNFGARIVNLWVPDKNGNATDVVLGFNTIDQYVKEGEYHGAIVGRYANRIAKGKFTLNGKEYVLAVNNGENHLHGGLKGFSDVVWEAKAFKTADGEDALELNYVSVNGEEGYPGEMAVQVIYTLNNNNELEIDYQVTAQDSTYLNITNHAFFNLKGEGNGEVGSHVAMINAKHYTPTDAGLIPTGEIAPVAGTPMDFTSPTVIDARVNNDFEALKLANGYDHNWVLDKASEGALTLAAEIYEPSTGIMMVASTTEPAMQFYGGNFLKGDLVGKKGVAYNFRTAFCFEMQHYPDSPNHPEFPSTLLTAGETYTQTTVYKFDVVK